MPVAFLSRMPARKIGAPEPEVYAFGPFILDTARHTLTRDGRPVTLTPKGFDLLLLFVRSGGRVLSRQELITALWPDTFVEEGNLSFQMSLLRKALGEAPIDDAAGPNAAVAWIETVPKVGYRFTPDVSITIPDTYPRRRRVLTAAFTTSALVGTAIVAGALGWMWTFSDEPVGPRSAYGTTAVPLTSYPGWEGSPTLSPDGTQVVFNWNGFKHPPEFPDLFVKLVGDGEPLRLTSHPGVEYSAAWSPDGQRLAYLRLPVDASEWDLVVMPSLGGTERRIASLWPIDSNIDHRGTNLLSWTPDGKWLALGAIIDGEAGIWLIEVDGPGRRKVTQVPPLRTDRSPALSSDGRRLAFIRSGPISRAALLVVALEPDLTVGGPPREVVDPWPHYVGSVAWGADQQSLVYAVGGHMGMSRLEVVRLGPDRLSSAGVPEPLPFGDQATGLAIAPSGRVVYVRRSRDSGFWSLDLDHPDRGLTEVKHIASSFDEHTPHFSPDGRRLVFASTRSGTEEIWIADVDGTSLRKMTSMGGPLCANPQWSPDGRQVVFNSARAGSSDLYLLDPDTAGIRQLTSDPGWEEQPRWSRDGRWIYFAARGEGQPQTDIWKISPSGGETVRVTTGGGLTAEESHDGRALYVARGPSETRGSFPARAGASILPVVPPGIRQALLWRVPLEGGAESLVASDLSGTLDFVVGRQAVYFEARVEPATTANSVAIVAVDVNTGRRVTLVPSMRYQWFGMALSPDERRLLVSADVTDNLDLMLVDPP